jgi:phosphoribosyl 1,2-cyclic phosphodiesterase
MTHNGQLKYGPFEIETFYVHHPGITFGYRIKVHGKVIVYVSDNELAFMARSIQDRRGELSVEELALVDAMQIEEHNKSLDSIRDAHIFIHDSQYTTEDYVKKRGWGHSCYVDTVNFAMDAEVKQLFLFHVDPNYPDNKIEELHRSCVKIVHERRSAMECHIAREGLIIDIDAL